ncbi:hypothetical protein P175DRAFT_0107552 [Aspergillus ochraceoroseus IBT 24754]|uniref:Uncharacterized protein n=1 Tax=Aspergillus ochraceoroseus IBT 24754 TaxID=1392256 RepID=A0A2T5LM38_9EURO|nr:uncharacterized protein P175DRAFT_0107552 [Aspergillus ochraceoroseus IBT 24754]PTU17346.1 hypothetical protein P175DRAFT_0107552 [Aspergillus ochraceoroseus IBT 24754]
MLLQRYIAKAGAQKLERASMTVPPFGSSIHWLTEEAICKRMGFPRREICEKLNQMKEERMSTLKLGTIPGMVSGDADYDDDYYPEVTQGMNHDREEKRGAAWKEWSEA